MKLVSNAFLMTNIAHVVHETSVFLRNKTSLNNALLVAIICCQGSYIL